MTDDLRKLKDQAAMLVERSKHAAAVGLYRKLAAAEPRDARWPQKMGELQRKLGETAAAVESFAEAARRFAEAGFLVKAIALCRVILELNPEHTATQEMLARLSGSGPRPAPPRRAPATAPTTPPPDSVSAAVAAAPAPAPASAGEPSLPRRRTIPPGAALDAVELRRVLPEARLPEAGGLVRVGTVEIPLDAQVDAAFAEVINHEPSSPPPLRLPAVPLLSELDERSLRQLIERVAVRHYSPKDRIISEGAPGESLYVLAEGEVVVLHERPTRIEINHLTEGAFFGEIALLTHLPRSATVEAVTRVTALELSREVMADLINEHPTVLKVLLRFFRDRLISSLLETSEIFTPFTPTQRRELVSRFTFLECDPGLLLICEGAPADGLYILLCGTLEARRGREPIAELSAGSVVGERSLLSGAPETTSIVGRTRCWALKLDRSAFLEMIMTHPHILAYLSELAEREPAETRLRLV
jgi:CRP-like cAMP-binding protein